MLEVQMFRIFWESEYVFIVIIFHCLNSCKIYCIYVIFSVFYYTSFWSVPAPSHKLIKIFKSKLVLTFFCWYVICLVLFAFSSVEGVPKMFNISGNIDLTFDFGIFISVLSYVDNLFRNNIKWAVLSIWKEEGVE